MNDPNNKSQEPPIGDLYGALMQRMGCNRDTAKNVVFAAQYGSQVGQALVSAALVPGAKPTIADLAKETLSLQTCGCFTTLVICATHIMTHLYMMESKFCQETDPKDRLNWIRHETNRHPISIMLGAKLHMLAFGRSVFDFGQEHAARTALEEMLRADGSDHDDPQTRSGV